MARVAFVVAAAVAASSTMAVIGAPSALRGPEPPALSQLDVAGGSADAPAMITEQPKSAREHAEPLAPETLVTPQGVVQHVLSQVDDVVRGDQQSIVALVAFVVGLVFIIDGELSFKWGVAGTVFLFFFAIAESDLIQVWPSTRGTTLGRIVGLEMGLLGAIMAWMGIDGVVVAIGACLGGWLAFETKRLLIAAGCEKLESDRVLVVAFYSVFVAIVVLTFRFKKHVRLVILICAAAGSTLLASATSWALTQLVVTGHLGFVKSAIPDATPVSGDWADFFMLLWSSATPDVGLFAGSKYNLDMHGTIYRTDRIVWLTISVLIFFFSSKSQFRALSECDAREARNMGSGSLEQALLSEE